jgi:dienelactone hydrolase
MVRTTQEVRMSEIAFAGEPVVGNDVVERSFTLAVEDHVVPGIIWTPDVPARTRPVVLIGHGGSLHKRTDYVLALARRLVRHQGFAAVAIDAPGHGDRADDAPPLRTMTAEQARDVSRTAVADWKATLDAVSVLPDVDGGPVGWWGLSMGTALGVPYVAREPRVQVAVFGLAGVNDQNAERFCALAERITVPILFLVQLEDELMTREGMLRLFDAFGSADKRLHANPGRHAAVPVEEIDASEAFLAKHLVPAAAHA